MSKYNDESILEHISNSSEGHPAENEREYNSEPSMSNTEEVKISKNKKRALWARKIIEENNIEPDEVLKESKKTRTQSCYVSLATELNKIEPSTL